MSDRRIVERLRQWPLSEKLAIEASDRIEALEAAQETALGYATRFLEHFVNAHCSPVPNWQPLPYLLGVLTQIDNSTTVARDYKARIEALEADVDGFVGQQDKALEFISANARRIRRWAGAAEDRRARN